MARSDVGDSNGELEPSAEERARWQAAYEVRCKRVGYPKKGGTWDPAVWRAEGHDDMADFIIQTWGVPWRPKGYGKHLRDQRAIARREERVARAEAKEDAAMLAAARRRQQKRLRFEEE